LAVIGGPDLRVAMAEEVDLADHRPWARIDASPARFAA